jgi:hypothetical protein
LFLLVLLLAGTARAADIDPFMQRQALLLGTDYAAILCVSLKRGGADGGEVQNDRQTLTTRVQQRATLLDTKIDDLSPGAAGGSDGFRTGLEMSRRIANRLESRRGSSSSAAFRLGMSLFIYACVPPRNYDGRRVFAELKPQMDALRLPAALQDQVKSTVDTTRGDAWATQMLASSDATNAVLTDRFARTETGARLRVALWDIGNNLSFAAIGRARNDESMSVQAFAHANDIAAAPPASIPTAPGFPPRLPALPPRSGVETTDLALAFSYIMNDVGQSVGAGLREYYGDSFASLFELGAKLPISGLVYQPTPGDKMTGALISMIRRAGSDAKLPPPLYRVIADGMERLTPERDMTQLIVNQIDVIRRELQQQVATANASAPR